MTIRSPRVFLVLSVVLVLTLYSSASAAIFNPLIQAKIWADRIEGLIKENKNAQVEAETQKFISWLKKYDQNYPRLESFIATAYNQKATAEAKQGKYNEAANTIRESHAWKPNPGNIDKVMKYEQNDAAQREYYAKALEFQNKRIELKRQILNLVQQKEKLVNELLKAKDVTKEQLEKLQASLKELSAKVAALRKEQSEVHATYVKDTEKFRKDGILFNARQSAVINAKAQTAAKLVTAIGQVETRVAKGLLTITEKYKWSWSGLEELLGKMKDLQVKIMDLQKQMLGIMDKKPLSEADKKKLLELKEQLDKLLEEQNKVMADLEKAFMDTKTFNKLTADQQAKYLEMFKTIREAENVIEKTTAKIEAFLKQMVVKYGDLNKDGKIDALDLAQMVRLLIGIRPMIWPWNPIPAADLDGDGHLTWADYNLLKEAVGGDRKTFPVDPENKRGDMDGNGVLDHEDVYMVAKYITDPKSFAKIYGKVADVNGDGKVNMEDLSTLIKNITTPVVPVTKDDTVASDTAVATGSGDASGVTTGDTGTGDAADTLDSGY